MIAFFCVLLILCAASAIWPPLGPILGLVLFISYKAVAS
jgi:hypothetical protein